MEMFIGSWKSYKTGWGGNAVLQGKKSYTTLRFLKDGTLFSEIKRADSDSLACFDSRWRLLNEDGALHILIDGIPFYQVLSLEKDLLVLKAYSGTALFLVSEKEWNRIDFPVDQVNVLA